MNPEELGRRIAARRKAMGVTQQWLAAKAGTSLSTIQSTERGRSTVRGTTLARIMDALGMSQDGDPRPHPTGSDVLDRAIGEIWASSATDAEKRAMIRSLIELHAECRGSQPPPGALDVG